jgi:hypothetical protein
VGWALAQVVAVQGDVERSGGYRTSAERLGALREAPRQDRPSGGDSEKDQIPRSGVFEDLVGDPIDGPGDVRG